MARLLYRIGQFAARKRRSILVAWLIALIGFGGAALGLHGTMTDAVSIPGTPAQAAMAQMATKLPAFAGATGRIVFAVPKGQALTGPAYSKAVSSMLAQAAELPSVTRVVDPQQAKAISPDGRVSMAQIMFKGQITEVPVETQTRLADLASEFSVDGMTIDLSGAAVKQMPAIGSTEGLGVVIALVVLLITFGSVVAAGLPLLTALIGIGVGMSGILIVSGFTEMTSTAPILALMLGLAVGIDYALFIVNRHRLQMRHGMEIKESIGRAVGTAGSAVVFAGLTVVIALAALTVVGIPFLSVMGIAAAGTVVMAVAVAITLVPALLGFAGPKVLRRKDRARYVAARASADSGTANSAVDGAADSAAVDTEAASNREPVAVHTAVQPRKNRWATFVGKRPIAVLIVGVIALGVLAIPAFSLRLGLPDDGNAAPTTTQRHGYDLISGAFGPGANGPLIVTVQPNSPAGLNSALLGTMNDLAKLPNVVAAQPAGAAPDGTMGVVQVIPGTGPSEVATEDLVHAIRAMAPELGQRLGATIDVTGQTAMQIDVSDKLASALPVYLAIVVGLALILLLVVFRSILVPIKAALGFLLSIAVSFGLVVAVFQWGWLGSMFGVHTASPIVSFLPIILVGVLFGLAMDYEVFLVAGMREAWVHQGRHTGDAKGAVHGGFSAGSRVVTAAAIIMGSVFGGFILAPDSIIASIGFALALGVLVDAFVVRMTLVPAVMTLLGRHAWYLPKWLDKILPNVDIEGAALDEAAGKHEKESALIPAG
ncbi:MAG: MMPL family transporter [Nakamurella sp.]